MVRNSITPPARAAPPLPWKRTRRRQWARRNGSVFVDVAQAIAAMSRETLTRLTDRMIERRDELDGDTDLEKADD